MFDYELAAFFERVSLIIEDRSQRVSENRDGLIEDHPVLLKVESYLPYIPKEFHASDCNLRVICAERRIPENPMVLHL